MKHVIPSLLATLLFSAGAIAAGGTGGTDRSETGGGAMPTFERLDANNDGAISKDEAQRVEWLDDQFAELDANGDGRLTRAEYAAAQPGGAGGDNGGMGGGTGNGGGAGGGTQEKGSGGTGGGGGTGGSGSGY